VLQLRVSFYVYSMDNKFFFIAIDVFVYSMACRQTTPSSSGHDVNSFVSELINQNLYITLQQSSQRRLLRVYTSDVRDLYSALVCAWFVLSY